MDRRWGLTLPLAGVPLADHRELIQFTEQAGMKASDPEVQPGVEPPPEEA